MNASKTNLLIVTISATLMMASVSLAKNSQGGSSSVKKSNKSSNTISSNSLGLSHGANLISDPGKKKKPNLGNTTIDTNLGINGKLSGKKDGGFKMHDGNSKHWADSFKWKNKYWYCDHSHHIVFCDHFVEPVLARYIVVPGDTFELISLKLFNTPHHSLFLASLNGLPVNSLLVPGQAIVIPTF